jgi:hypothetical protein
MGLRSSKLTTFRPVFQPVKKCYYQTYTVIRLKYQEVFRYERPSNQLSKLI